MTRRRLVVRPRARRELAEAMQWYDEQRPGLGKEFLDSFRAATASIEENPFQYQLFGKRARRAGLRGFPHGLIYQVSDTTLVILACFHPSRDPMPWR